MEMFDLEHYDELQKMYKHKYFRLDPEMGMLSETDVPLPQGRSYLSFVGEGYYIYMEGGDTVDIDPEGYRSAMSPLTARIAMSSSAAFTPAGAIEFALIFQAVSLIR